MGAVTSTLERMVIDVAWSCHEWFYGSATGAGTCNNPRPAITRRRCRQNMPSSSSSSSGSSGSSDSSSGGGPRRRAQHAQHPEKLTAAPAAVASASTSAALLQPSPPPAPTATSCRGLPSFPFRGPGDDASATSATSASSDDDWGPPPSLRRLPRHDLAFPEASASCQPRRRATMSLMYPGSRRYHHHHHHHQDDDGLGQVPRQPRRPNVPYSTLQAMLFRCTAARNGCLSSKDYKDKAYPVRRLGRSWSVHNATANRAATL